MTKKEWEQFKNDNEAGKIIENAIAELYEKEGYKKGNDYRYDIATRINNRIIKMEVKYEKGYPLSPDLFLEYSKKKEVTQAVFLPPRRISRFTFLVPKESWFI